jgi:hypothetical protein
VKESLIREVERMDDPPLARHYGVSNPFGVIRFELVLAAIRMPAPGDHD